MLKCFWLTGKYFLIFSEKKLGDVYLIGSKGVDSMLFSIISYTSSTSDYHGNE